jgi:hypothetical protein
MGGVETVYEALIINILHIVKYFLYRALSFRRNLLRRFVCP